MSNFSSNLGQKASVSLPLLYQYSLFFFILYVYTTILFQKIEEKKKRKSILWLFRAGSLL
jgi:hypothetical protein